MTRRLSLALLALVALGVSAPAGCGWALLPPQQPIISVSAIAGKWRGNIQFGRGPYELFYLTINPDGSLVAWWGITTRWGKLDLEGRRTRFSLYIWSGDLEYFVGGGQRILTLKEDFGGFYAQVTPLTARHAAKLASIWRA